MKPDSTRANKIAMIAADESQFSLFPNLPSELRIKIWRVAFPGPRCVAVRYNKQHAQYTSDGPPPTLLQTCAESRNIFLSTYEKLMFSPKHESSVYVDFSRDTIYFNSLACSPDGDLAFDLATSPQRQKILYCAIDAQLWEVLRIFRDSSLSEVAQLRNLKTIALVLRQDYERTLGAVPITRDGRETVVIEGDSTMNTEIRHVHGYVNNLRWELEQARDIKWASGHPPNVQMWIW